LQTTGGNFAFNPKKKKIGFGIVMMVVDSVLQLEVWAATAYTGGVCFGK